MSDVSSSAPTQSERPLPGWLIAVLALLATLFLYYFAQFVGSIIVSIYPFVAGMTNAQANLWLQNSVGVQFLYGLIADGLLVAGVVLLLKWLHWDWTTIGFHRPTLVQLVIGVLAVAPYFVLYLALVFIAKLFFPALDINQQQDIGFDTVHGSAQLVLAFVSLVILPPLAEETLMRGFLYTGLKKWVPWIVAGLIVSLLFGAGHLAEGGDAGPLWIGAIDTFTLSLVLVGLREKTGNLWAGIMLHATKNCVAFVALFVLAGR